MKLSKLLLVAITIGAVGIAIAATVNIDARAAPYREVEVAKGVELSFPISLRAAALAGLAGMYRSLHGVSSLPGNSTINVTWHDGGKEKAKVTCLGGVACVQPIPGTDTPAPGGGGAGGWDWENGGGLAGGPQCDIVTRYGEACVGVGGAQRCETMSYQTVECW